ncbi:MAG: hypothetical protein JST92_14330, partial [Deltaproteobacteria bacterium]|nr:hypothetical protein [Deltaproteobacteria bacterium]
MTRRRAIGFSLALSLAAAIPQAARADDDLDEVKVAEESLKAIGDRLKLVERQYGSSDDPSELLELRKRFSDGETQYLLGEFANASALLYDVVDSKAFQSEPTRLDALLYLADSLFQEGSWLESRRYFRELAELKDKHLQDALLRLIELSDKVGDSSGIDEAYAALVAQSGGVEKLKPEVRYVHAKWMARRLDLADDERIARALGAFHGIDAQSVYAPQARYFEGALLVQKGQLVAALQSFERMLALPQIAQAMPASEVAALANDPRDLTPAQVDQAKKLSHLRDLGMLAMGRVFFEQNEIAQAIERYQRIDRESESYVDALYELSACWQKLDEPEKALRSTELLLLVIEDSVMAPEARLQQASLLLKLKRYSRAIEQYEQLGAELKPVRDRIDELVKRDDPVAYYDELLAQGDNSLDATQLLPETARKYVSGRDAAQARVIVSDLGAGRRTLGEADEILKRLDEAFRKGSLDLFPAMQEGNVRAVEVENALLLAEAQFTAVETRRIEAAQVSTEKIVAARKKRQALDAQAAALPDTAAAFEARRDKALEQVAALDKIIFRLGNDIDGLNAQLAAAEKWQKDTAESRRGQVSAQDEREFAQRIENDKQLVGQLERERGQLVRRLEIARGTAAAATAGGSGEERLRAQYLAALQEESAASRGARERLPEKERALIDR